MLKEILVGAMAMVLLMPQADAARPAQKRGGRGVSKTAVVGKRLASAVKVEEQVKHIREVDTNDDMLPADYLYSSVWSNTSLNPYDLQLPDSFKIIFDEYAAPVENQVTSEYGPRWGRFHAGIDIALHKGDSVRVAFDGQVRIAHRFDKDGYGWYVVVRHSNGLETLYGHLSKSLAYNNQQVKAGDVIGLGGSTGRSTGPHLHFETRFLGAPMNPRNIINFDENVLKSDNYVVYKDSSFTEIAEYKAQKASHKYAKNKRVRGGKHHRGGRQAGVELASSGNIHIVHKGDNLSKIAKRNNTSISKICKRNNLDRDAILSLGQRIYLD